MKNVLWLPIPLLNVKWHGSGHGDSISHFSAIFVLWFWNCHEYLKHAYFQLKTFNSLHPVSDFDFLIKFKIIESKINRIKIVRPKCECTNQLLNHSITYNVNQYVEFRSQIYIPQPVSLLTQSIWISHSHICKHANHLNLTIIGHLLFYEKKFTDHNNARVHSMIEYLKKNWKCTRIHTKSKTLLKSQIESDEWNTLHIVRFLNFWINNFAFAD